MDNAGDLSVRVSADTGRFNAGMARTQQQFNRSASAIEGRAGQLAGRLSKLSSFEFSRQGRAQFINFGQQIQDVAVQAEMGTNALRIFSQQGPQILSIFGPVGVTLGIVAAIGGTLASVFMSAGEAATENAKAIDVLGAAHQAAREAMELLSLSSEEMTERFGENVVEANRLRVELANLAVEGVRREIQALSGDLRELFSEMSSGGAGRELRNTLKSLESQFDITALQAVNLNRAFQDFDNAGSFDDQIGVLEDIQGLLDAYGVKLGDLPPEIVEAFEQMTNLRLENLEAADAADDLKAALDRGADAAGRFTDQATLLKQEMQAAARAAQVAFETQSFLLSRRPDIAAEDKLFGLPVAVSSSVTSEISRRNRPKRSRRSGGRSRQKRDQFPQQIERVQERIEALEVERQKIGLTERAAEQLTAAFDREKLVRELVNAAQKDGTKATESEIQRANELADQTQALTLAIFDEKEALEAANEAAKKAKKDQADLAKSISSTSDKFINAVKSAESFEDALKKIGIQLLELAANALVGQGPLGGAFNDLIGVGANGLVGLLGSGGGAVSSGAAASSLPAGFAKGGVFAGGQVTAFAKGGVVGGPTVFPMKNGTGLMGEAGPEAVIPLKRGPDGKLGVVASGGMGGKTITVAPTYNISGLGMTPVEVEELMQRNNRNMVGILDERLNSGY